MDDNLQNTILVSALFVLIALVFAWAAFIRKPSRRREKHPRPRPVLETNLSTAASVKQRKRRRRKRTQLPTNPTLAEIRGLPPIRNDYRASGDYYQQ